MKQDAMIEVRASTLEDAITQASDQLGCSIADMHYEVVQNPKKGFFGFGRKEAVVKAGCPNLLKKQQEKPSEKQPVEEKQEIKPAEPIRQETVMVASGEQPSPAAKATAVEAVPVEPEQETPLPETAESDPHTYRFGTAQEDSIIDGFYQSHQTIDDAAEEIKAEINHLFEGSCFLIDPIEVRPFDDHTIFIEFTGEDAALLIGKEGYRYKALSYMLFNWINARYGHMIRLEIAEFLKNQEEMISNYLRPIIERISSEGRGQTKPLDGVLAHIALKQLREAFPDKYVSFRQKGDGDRYVVVSSYNK